MNLTFLKFENYSFQCKTTIFSFLNHCPESTVNKTFILREMLTYALNTQVNKLNIKIIYWNARII